MLFQWTAIQAGQFRLLERRAPLPWGEPSYVLRTFAVGSAPSYAAIVYKHGLGQKTESVVLNGRSFSVEKAALDALMQVERREDYQHLWIDCLCIHQSDDLERAHQEQMMDQIFRGADAVLACVSEDAPGASKFREAAKRENEKSCLQPDDGDRAKAFRNFLGQLGVLSNGKSLWECDDLRTELNVFLHNGSERYTWAQVRRILTKDSYQETQSNSAPPSGSVL
ncbi:uncharacterized protein PV09_05348 [Verruconis gallopava]|uniref:Heterokaryon incompatibility domain-containing protein n=1 Tax=Verruconis gallopava TaxID=253628 RepID=A0A0D2AWR3_9PEZI|nr:uncharacterized protein PV09_05348 [Verruconis gallopava]KIW03594.1 hypothetical protein PV09_05348 [Verruconis gallopava]